MGNLGKYLAWGKCGAFDVFEGQGEFSSVGLFAVTGSVPFFSLR
jgi:hypothetical protein